MNLYYASADTILSKKGFRVRFLSHSNVDRREEKYCVLEDRHIETAVHAGSLSAVGLNFYLRYHFQNTFEHAAMFAIDGGVGGTFEAGRLAEEFPLAVDASRDPGFQQDMLVCDKYQKMDTRDFKDFDYESLGQNKPWIMGIKVSEMPFSIQGTRVVYELPKEPFYLVFKEQHPETVDYLRKAGFFVLNVGELCVVSNWVGVEFCLPPNPIVLGNKKIDMNKHKPAALPLEASSVDEESSSSGLNRFRRAPRKPLAAPLEPAKKEKVDFETLLDDVKGFLEKYQEKPSYNAYIKFFTPKDKIKAFMTQAAKKEKIRTGPKRKSMIPSVRTRCESVDLTWENLYDVVLDVCGDEVTALYTMGNLRAGIVEEDGKPAFTN